MENVRGEQTLVLKNRRELVIDGVDGVRGFDSEYVQLTTPLGGVTVEGRELIIEDLSKKDSRVTLKGEISAIYYDSSSEKRGGFLGFFRK